MHDSQCANPLKPLNFKLLNKKALSFEQLFPTKLTVDHRPLTIDSRPYSQNNKRRENQAPVSIYDEEATS